MPSTVITRADERGITGYDSNGVRFGVFHGQIADLVKTPMGCAMILETGEHIPMMMCYNRLGKILKDSKGA
jgi:hypothetical protein